MNITIKYIIYKIKQKHTKHKSIYIYIYIYIYNDKNWNQNEMKEYDKPKSHISNKLMLVIPFIKRQICFALVIGLLKRDLKSQKEEDN